MFVTPDHYDLRVTANGAPEYWTEQVMELLRPISTTHSAFHWPLPALSRWASGFDRRGSQACRSSLCSGSRHPRDRREVPLEFEYVRARIEHALREYEGRFIVVALPNITNVFYGRDVGYAVERIDLDHSIQEISATDLRKRLSVKN